MYNGEFIIKIEGENRPDSLIRSKSLKVEPSDELLEGLGVLVGVENVWLSRQVPPPEIDGGDQWWMDR